MGALGLNLRLLGSREGIEQQNRHQLYRLLVCTISKLRISSRVITLDFSILTPEPRFLLWAVRAE